jgi:hypothetical protein
MMGERVSVKVRDVSDGAEVAARLHARRGCAGVRPCEAALACRASAASARRQRRVPGMRPTAQATQSITGESALARPRV